MDLLKQLDKVIDEKTFLEFARALQADKEDENRKEKSRPSSPYSHGRNGWENSTIDGFLESALCVYSKMIKINEFFLIDHDFDSPEQYENWRPEDLYDYSEWIKVLVGTNKNKGGSWFQVHVCSADALSRIQDTSNIFRTNYWNGVDNLIEELETYLNEFLPNTLETVDYEKLSEIWSWEYEKNT